MKVLSSLLLALVTTACHQTAPATVESSVPVAAVRPAGAKPASAPAADTTLTPATLAMLQQYNLALLWANQGEGKTAKSAMEGFYGDKPYRISFYFSSVERDAAQPNLFHVTGMDRYKKVITPFSGTITVRELVPFADSMGVEAPDSTARAFTAMGQFVLKEDPTTKGAGNYTGDALLDFYYDAHGHLSQAVCYACESNPTKGCGLLFRGTQTSNQTGRRQPVAFAGFYGAVVPNALLPLGLGDRSDEVNPNLARLGWNEAWENDEWWAKSPKPKLNL